METQPAPAVTGAPRSIAHNPSWPQTRKTRLVSPAVARIGGLLGGDGKRSGLGDSRAREREHDDNRKEETPHQWKVAGSGGASYPAPPLFDVRYAACSKASSGSASAARSLLGTKRAAIAPAPTTAAPTQIAGVSPST